MKKYKKIIIPIVSIIIIICAIQASLTLYQASRYVRHVYDCTDMSKDCEEFFEYLGIRTQVIYGDKLPDELVGHCWLRLHTNIGEFEFESTQLRFMNVSENWNNIKVTEGWIE